MVINLEIEVGHFGLSQSYKHFWQSLPQFWNVLPDIHVSISYIYTRTPLYTQSTSCTILIISQNFLQGNQLLGNLLIVYLLWITISIFSYQLNTLGLYSKLSCSWQL